MIERTFGERTPGLGATFGDFPFGRVIRAMSLTAALLLLTFGCRGGERATGPEATEATALEMGPTSVYLTAGETTQLDATPVDGNGNPVSGYQISWTSGDTAVATVDGDGTVTGLSVGSTEITATAEKTNNGQGSDNGQGKKKGLKKQSDVTVTDGGLITNLEPAAYEKDTLETGDSVYVDRAYMIDEVPSGYGGWRYVRTANDDKDATADSAVAFTLTDTARVALAYDIRATTLPDWLRDWTATGDTLHTTDVDHLVYTRVFAPGDVVLGGNLSGGAEGAYSMYLLSATRSSSAPDDGGSGGTDTTTATGSLAVTTSTTGDSLDSDGYTVSVDGGSGQVIGLNETTVYSDLTADSHTVELTGVEGNCSVAGSNPRTVSVTENDTTATLYEVGCTAQTTDDSFRAHEPPGMTRLAVNPFNELEPDGWTKFTQHLSIVDDSDAPNSPSNIGSWLLEAQSISEGSSLNAGALRTSQSFDISATEIYIDLYVKLSSNWQNHETTTNKIGFVVSDEGGGGDPFYLNARGANSFDPDGPMFWAGQLQHPDLPNRGFTQNLNRTNLSRGSWHHIELLLAMNTPGEADGEFHMWIDGIKRHESQDVKWRTSSGTSFKFFKINPIWGGQEDTLEEDQKILLDHIYVSGK